MEWVAISFSRASSRPGGRFYVSHVSCTAGGSLVAEPPGKPCLNAFSDQVFFPFIDLSFHICLQASYLEEPFGASSEFSVSLWVFLGLRWAAGEIFLQPCPGELPTPLVASGLCPKERPRKSGRPTVDAEHDFVQVAPCEQAAEADRRLSVSRPPNGLRGHAGSKRGS